MAQFLRLRLADLFGGSKIVTAQIDQEAERQFQALENIIKNVHQNAYPRANKSTSSGLTGDQCKQILSSEFLEYINNDGTKESSNAK